jgi:hypothetical protein
LPSSQGRFLKSSKVVTGSGGMVGLGRVARIALTRDDNILLNKEGLSALLFYLERRLLTCSSVVVQK